MKIVRHIIAATCLLVGALYLFGEHRPQFPDDSLSYYPYEQQQEEQGIRVSEQVLPNEELGHVIEISPDASLDPPPENVPEASDIQEISSQDTSALLPSDDTLFEHDAPQFPAAELPVLEFPAPEPPAADIPASGPLAADLQTPALSAPNSPPPEPPQPELPQAPLDPSTPKDFQIEFPFQKDLDLDLPIDVLSRYSSAAPINYNPSGPKTNVYATFMATRNPSLKDPYYLAIHSLIYRILWSPRTRTEKYAFVVFVAEFVTEEQRQLLRGAGAIVRQLAAVEWPGNPDVEGVQHRWRDLFAKLNMWRETEFEKIHFLDADAFPVANLDGIFELAPLQKCRGERLSREDDYFLDGTNACTLGDGAEEAYVFAGVAQSPDPDSTPPSSTNPNLSLNINVGSMVFSPSLRTHTRLLANFPKTSKYDARMAEQAFLNWQFSADGAFPPTVLAREWGGFFPQEHEEGRLRVVHEKIWNEPEGGWMRREWEGVWEEMMGYYRSGGEFEGRRARAGEDRLGDD